MKNIKSIILYFYKPVFIAFLLFLYPLSIKAQETLVYTADQTLADVANYVHFYKDETNALTFEQIKNLPDAAFQKSKSSPLRFGMTTANVWLRFAIKNQTESPLFLAFQSNALNIVDEDSIQKVKEQVLRTEASFIKIMGTAQELALLGEEKENLFIGEEL